MMVKVTSVVVVQVHIILILNNNNLEYTRRICYDSSYVLTYLLGINIPLKKCTTLFPHAGQCYILCLPALHVGYSHMAKDKYN
jgi:hypothetical protein